MHTPHACILSFYVVHTSRPKMITSSPSQNLHLESVPTVHMGGSIGGRGQVEGEGQAHQVDKGQSRNQDLVTADTQSVHFLVTGTLIHGRGRRRQTGLPLQPLPQIQIQTMLFAVWFLREHPFNNKVVLQGRNTVWRGLYKDPSGDTSLGPLACSSCKNP